MLPYILIFSLIVLILTIKIIWDRLDLNLEVWRFRDDSQFCWVFEQFQHRLEAYTGIIKHTAADMEIIRWKSKQEPKNTILVYDDNKELRPRYRGRWLYHVHAGELVPLPYTLTSKASGGLALSAEDIRAWIQADFAQSFATAIRESLFGWREIILIVILLTALISVFFGYQTIKSLRLENDTLNRIEQRLPSPTTSPTQGELQ